MDAKEKLELDVIQALREHSIWTAPWLILVLVMFFLFYFCNDLPGDGVYLSLRYTDEKFMRKYNKFDIAVFTILKLFLSSMADLHGRRKVCCILATATCLIFIPIAILLHFEIGIAAYVFFKIQFYLMPSLNMAFFVNFVELCGRFTKLICSVGLLSFACATETLTLPMDIVYRKYIMVSALTIPIFISWYLPESPLWLLNKNKAHDVWVLLKETLGVAENNPPQFKEYAKYSQFRIWKETMRYLFTKRWRSLLRFMALSIVNGICVTQVAYYTIHDSIPIRIPLSLFSIFIIAIVYTCLGLRLGLLMLYGALLISEMAHFIILLAGSDLANESLHIIWCQYVLVWAIENFSILFLTESFPTFVRVTAVALFLIVQDVIANILHLIGSQSFSLDHSYVSGAKVLCIVLLGIIPLKFSPETFFNKDLPNDKLENLIVFG